MRYLKALAGIIINLAACTVVGAVVIHVLSPKPRSLAEGLHLIVVWPVLFADGLRVALVEGSTAYALLGLPGCAFLLGLCALALATWRRWWALTVVGHVLLAAPVIVYSLLFAVDWKAVWD